MKVSKSVVRKLGFLGLTLFRCIGDFSLIVSVPHLAQLLNEKKKKRVEGVNESSNFSQTKILHFGFCGPNSRERDMSKVKEAREHLLKQIP